MFIVVMLKKHINKFCKKLDSDRLRLYSVKHHKILVPMILTCFVSPVLCTAGSRDASNRAEATYVSISSVETA